MKKITACFLFLLVLSVKAQEEKFHKISLKNENNKAIESDFYIDKVYDGRQVKENIGTVYVSLFNNKVSAKFEQPFEEELQSLLTVLYPKTENKKPLSIRVNELYITEANSQTEGYKKKQIGTATIVFDLIERKEDGNQYIVGTFFSSREDTRGDVTKKHAELITGAITTSFENYKNTRLAYKNPMLFNPEEIVTNDITKTEIKAGVYLNYKDVFSGQFLSLDDYTITKYKEGFCLLNNITGRVETGFYGFSDGQKFYLNLFQFSTVKFYLKAEIMGGNYFIDEVEESTLDFNSFYIAYGAALGGGIIPLLVLSTSSNVGPEPKRMPLIIDRITGMPTFFTDRYVLDMLQSNQVLLKEYKKTKRTPADKKMIYKKLNNL